MSEQIFLTGFMGTGKSKIGQLLARRLQREFLDPDRMIEERAGQSITGRRAVQPEKSGSSLNFGDDSAETTDRAYV